MANILAVDDNLELCKLIRTTLERDGHRVETRQAGRDLTEALCRWADCILLDVMMPGEDGFAVCRRIRSLTEVPILFLSARTDEAAVLEGLGIGADDFLSKPFRVAELRARVASGSEDNFAALMNQKATELGMKNTHFTNPTGLTDTEHYSSAADMAKLLQAALHNATFRTIFTAEHYTTTATAQHPEGVSLTSTLLGKLDGTELPEGAQIEGGKTGYTAAAGLCLASLATVNGKEYILVTLAAPGDHGTEQYNIRDAVQVYQKLADKK